jgi:hypothetical protein
MKNKDTLMLAEAYFNILKENQSEYVASGENDQHGLEDNSVESEETSNNKFSQLEIGLGRPNPSVEQGDLLQGLSENDARELLNHLNQKGEENEENWVLKDNLILQLFDLLRNPNI